MVGQAVGGSRGWGANAGGSKGQGGRQNREAGSSEVGSWEQYTGQRMRVGRQ